MNKRMILNVLFAALMLTFTGAVLQAAPRMPQSSNSPLPTPVATQPSTIGPSTETQKAIAYIAQRKDVPFTLALASVLTLRRFRLCLVMG